MVKKVPVLLGKIVRGLTRLRGGGSALPGLVVEKLDPKFLSRTLSKLPRGVVVVTGTNGKTTTTKIIVELLESSGLRVFTNRTGSNFTRGIVSALLGEIRGFQFDADIAVLELDEAYAVYFVKQIKPNYTLLLNVQPDQEDRFGGIEKTAKMLEKVADAAVDGVVLNRDDLLIFRMAKGVKVPVKYFGYNPKLAGKFGSKNSPKSQVADVELTSFMRGAAEYKIDGKRNIVSLQLPGAHNALNAAAGLAMTRMILGSSDDKKLLKTLSHIQPAYGRGEIINVNGAELDLILAKNPSGFRLSLAQYSQNADVMIAINNNYGDGVDPSWLDDVDFSGIREIKVVSGMCANEVAARLRINNIKFEQIEPNLKKALKILLSGDGKKQIFCNYTAMMQIRKLLGKITDIEKIV
jgi:UDP-N-acetylmuramyl tripeptide synthase